MTSSGSDHTWDVEVDRSTCIGSGLCVGVAPGYFLLDGGRSRPTQGLGNPQDPAILHAAGTCPALAIQVRLTGSDVIIAPAADFG